jgi:nucleoside-diphosphate-sugar epimerase
VTDVGELEAIADNFAITNIIHLAALQVPFCRSDPQRGGHVNVVGTINMLELAKRNRDLAHVVYASSVAALGTSFDDGVPSTPATLYGVFKRANEATASVYWHENHVSSIGLRPHTVYGLGRDQGLTSAPTHAMLAAAAGVAYRIPYGGRMQLHYARDVASAFVAASRHPYEGASVHNLPGHSVSMGEVVDAITTAVPESAGTITYDESPLPFPSSIDASSFGSMVGEIHETSLVDGVDETVRRFRQLMADGVIEAPVP